MSSDIGSRAFVFRGAVLASAALIFGSCGGGKLGGASTTTVDAGPITLIANGGPAGSVTADVALDEPGVGPEETCVAPVVAGACQLTSCQQGPIGDPGPGEDNFGPMTVTVGTTTVPLTYDFTGYPTVGFPSTVALGTGGIMRFHGGDGANIPTFDVSAIIPGLGVMTSPALPTYGDAPIIDTSQDLTVTWQPISVGQINFELYSDQVSTTSDDVWSAIQCTFEGASGSGVVPQTLVSALKGISGTTAVYTGLTSELEATTVIDGLTIVTQSYQSTSPPIHDFEVTLQ